MRIGIDLGGTKIEAIALARDGRTLFRQRVPTPVGDYAGTVRAAGQRNGAGAPTWPPAGAASVALPGRPEARQLRSPAGRQQLEVRAPILFQDKPVGALWLVWNDGPQRDLHDALKRRCLYHWIDYPDPARAATPEVAGCTDAAALPVPAREAPPPRARPRQRRFRYHFFLYRHSFLR